MNPILQSRRRRVVVAAGLALALPIGTPVFAQTGAKPAELRIGFQKYSTLMLMKTRGLLDKQLAAQGTSVRWIEFPGGPQMLEALNVGSIDFGNVGEAPPIFAQAAGADMVYVANDLPAPTAEAVVVRKDGRGLTCFTAPEWKEIAFEHPLCRGRTRPSNRRFLGVIA